MQDDTSFLHHRTWPVGRQVGALIIAAIIAAVVILLWMALGRKGPNSADANGTAPVAGQVRLSPEQLATMGIIAVSAVKFHDAVIADGQIAVNADTATQVFSPYSGRVVHVLTGVGDKVRSGSPLVSLDASENLDAQTTLITALSQAKLARVTETRRHAAYDSHGGSVQ